MGRIATRHQGIVRKFRPGVLLMVNVECDRIVHVASSRLIVW